VHDADLGSVPARAAHTYADRGAYTVTVTVTEGDENPASDTETFQITVEQPWDATPPTILSVSPREDQKGVPRTTDITITFSEEMDTASLNADTVRLVKAGSLTPIAVTRETSTDASGRTVLTLDPITPKLAKATTYKVTVEGADPPGDVFAARDLANNELANDKVWSFKTKRK
jgi:PKD repeat protein